MNKKSGAAIVLSACMALSLAACGSADRPATAAELMQKVAAAENATNYAVTGTVTMNMSIESGDATMSMPVTMDVSGAVMGADNHIIVNTTMSLFGNETTMVGETYTVDGVSYVGTSEDGGEMVWDEPDSMVDTADAVGFIENLTDASMFENAEMSYEDGVYTVTVPLADVDSMSSLLDEMDVSATGEEGSAEQMLADAVLTYKVDDGFYLQSVTMDDISYSEEDPDLGMTTNISMGLSFALSDYGSVTAEDLAVPEEALAASDTD